MGSLFSIPIHPVGVIHSSYQAKYEAPRQPLNRVEETSKGHRTTQIELFPHRNYEQAASDLVGFDRIWVLTWFDKNCTEEGQPIWKPKILPPRGRIKRGVFATRAPYRPNPIGMSVVQLLDVQSRHLVIADCDLLDGTPVLDIKPYIPLYDSFPDSRVGWLADTLSEQGYILTFSDTAQQQKRSESEEESTFIAYIESVLVRDPYPHPYRRIRTLGEGRFEIAMRLWRAQYFVNEKHKSVVIEHVWQHIEPNYPQVLY